MSGLEPIGEIVLLQIQKEQLVVGVRPDRSYRTGPLVSVDALTLSPDGVVARIDGGWVVDRHHTAHPANIQPDLGRLLSVGFTGHYDRMAADFDAVRLGVGGENVIVATPDRVDLSRIGPGVVIRTAAGDIATDVAAIAEPCIPFTRFLLGDRDATSAEVTTKRERLRGGMRGFVMGLGSLSGSVEIRLGDTVLAGAVRTAPA